MVEVKFWLRIAATILAVIWLLIPFAVAMLEGFFGVEIISLSE